MLSKYIDMESVILEESFRMSNEYTIDYGRDSTKDPSSFISQTTPIPEDAAANEDDRMDNLLGLNEDG